MAPARICLHQSHKSKSKLNFTEIAWENLRNECLLTPFSNKNEIERQDPNFVMNMRHKMFKKSSKILPSSQVQSHTEALKLLRLETWNRLMKQKEEKIIEKEVLKLKQTLENHRLSTKKQLNETFSKKKKSLSYKPKSDKHYPKLHKKLDSYDIINEVSCWLDQSVYKMMESKSRQQKIVFHIKDETEETSETFSTRKEPVIEDGIENEERSLKNEDNREIIMRFFGEKNFLGYALKQELDINDKLIIKSKLETKNQINQKKIGYATTWKPYVQQFIYRKGEKIIYRDKIETFLSNFQERESKHEKTIQLKNIIRRKHEIKTNFVSEKRIETQEKPRASEEKEEMLKKLTEEAENSQADAKQELDKITRKNPKSGGKFSNPKFLQRMERRRQERLTRRKEIQDKKLKLKEEKEKVEQEKEEKKKQNENEQKRKRLEEMKERQKLEKEKKLEQKRKMDNLRLNTKLAESHYETYLLRSYGWRPWTMLLKIRHLQYRHAAAFYEKKLTQKMFISWMEYVKQQVGTKTVNAVQHYERTLKKNCMLIWAEFFERGRKQYQAAVDWYELKITEIAFKTWFRFTQVEQLKYLNKKEASEQFYYRKLKVIYLKKLRNYPKFEKLEREKEVRKRIWRQKIKEILPDYQPVEKF